jgi:hypothetical protein
MPSDGYILISQEETMISIGIDSKDESKAIRIYGDEETYKKSLKKGTHKIYLFDGAGAHFFKNEYATIHYAIYVDQVITDNKDETPQSGDYKYYIIDETSCGIKSYVGKSEEVTVPSEIEGYKVTVIGSSAFSKCKKLKKIVIPKEVQKINAYAFWSCKNLSVITFESDSQLEKIGESAFYECKSLSKITIPKSVTKIGDGAFWLCEGLTSVTFESGIDLQKIGWLTFSECGNLKKIEIPRSVQKIGNNAFEYCKKLSKVTFEANSKLETIGDSAFSDCVSLTKIVFPKNLTKVGDNAFFNCKKLTSVDAGSKLQYIAEAAFEDCVKLKRITLMSKSIKKIEEDAFDGINKNAVFIVPSSKLTKYQKLLTKKAGFKSSMKIKAKA